jgi:NAD-dependent DNA ligase
VLSNRTGDSPFGEATAKLLAEHFDLKTLADASEEQLIEVREWPPGWEHRAVFAQAETARSSRNCSRRGALKREMKNKGKLSERFRADRRATHVAGGSAETDRSARRPGQASRNTTYVVAGADPGSKLKAQELASILMRTAAKLIETTSQPAVRQTEPLA